MILPVEAWMDLHRYRPLRDAGATWREIADEVGLDLRTVKRYLSTDAPPGPPVAPSHRRAREGFPARSTCWRRPAELRSMPCSRSIISRPRL